MSYQADLQKKILQHVCLINDFLLRCTHKRDALWVPSDAECCLNILFNMCVNMALTCGIWLLQAGLSFSITDIWMSWRRLLLGFE